MRVMLSALAIVALIAITGAATSDECRVFGCFGGAKSKGDERRAWFGPEIQGALPAEAINVGLPTALFRREKLSTCVILRPEWLAPQKEAEEHSVCKFYIGFAFNNGAKTFCEIILLGIIVNRDKSVSLVLRFNGYAGKDGRLEINISKLPKEEEKKLLQEEKKNKGKPEDFGSFFEFLDFFAGRKPAPLVFNWLSGFLKHGLVESAAPNVWERSGDSCSETFVTRPVLLSEKAMGKLLDLMVW